LTSDNFHERYYQCPYCLKHDGGHNVRVPKSVGKYRIKIIYDDVLTFQCCKCARLFKLTIKPQKVLWAYMSHNERLEFKEKQHITHKGGKKIDG
jgi:ribosomal protein L24E